MIPHDASRANPSQGSSRPASPVGTALFRGALKTLPRACFCFCLFSAAAYLFFVLRLFQGSPELLAFHGLFSLVLALLGCAFLFYYPYNRFCFLACMLSAAFIYGGFVLAFWFKTAEQQGAVMLVHAASLLALTVWKLGFADVKPAARLPLNVCNILVIFIIARPFFRHPVLDNYIVCFGIIAGLVYFCTGPFFDNTMTNSTHGRGFFHFRITESALLHNIFFSYCVFALMSENIRVNTAEAMCNMLWIIPVFFLFVFINQKWKTDYFFTGVYGITPGFLVKCYYVWPGRFTLRAGKSSFEVNMFHSIFVLGGAALALWAVSSGLAALQSAVFAGDAAEAFRNILAGLR